MRGRAARRNTRPAVRVAGDLVRDALKLLDRVEDYDEAAEPLTRALRRADVAELGDRATLAPAPADDEFVLEFRDGDRVRWRVHFTWDGRWWLPDHFPGTTPAPPMTRSVQRRIV